MNRALLNFCAFQIGWFTCVLGAANGMPWLSLVVFPIVFWSVRKSDSASSELLLIVLAVVLGLVLDSLLVNSGWLSYPSGVFIEGIAPYWILALWALFATTLNVSMSWLKRNLVLAMAMGAVFGPLSYMAGQRFGAIEIVNFDASMIALSIGWAVAMPLMLTAAIWLDGGPKQAVDVQLVINTGAKDA